MLCLAAAFRSLEDEKVLASGVAGCDRDAWLEGDFGVVRMVDRMSLSLRLESFTLVTGMSVELSSSQTLS